MKAHTYETQSTITPEKALEFLKEGNQRFVNNLKANRDLLEQVNATREGQWPFAVVLSCIDSRTSAELIFDQGLGMFSVSELPVISLTRIFLVQWNSDVTLPVLNLSWFWAILNAGH